MDYYVVTFNSITDAMRAEKLVQGIGGIIIPVPSEISAGCGFAVRLSEPEPAISILKNNAEFSGLYCLSGFGKDKTVVRIF